MDLGVGLLEAHVCQARAFGGRPGHREHPRRQVDAQDTAAAG
jgi:hypothetical protein